MKNKRSINLMLAEDDGYREMLPYERFMHIGAHSLTDAELLAIIIRTGTSNRTPMELGNAVLSMCNKYEMGLAGIKYLSVKELMSITGIGEVKAIKLLCIAELSDRIARSKAKIRLNCKNPKTIADYYMEEMCHYQREHVMLMCLNTQGQLISDFEISVGTVKTASLSPREIFIQALRDNAVQIILLHNHPSGDPGPSEADYELTEQISDAGRLLGIHLLDHIIIGDHKYYSFLENNVLKF
ncbi:RadC family protein [Butyrivibrio sp. AE3004]|uniref:RadC family protein n=1 Tax=Butyrivibrio sp. AE3004 TaxID=1506994 RepID=UPI000493D43F|nr:DNA repair protein RadC [Butyrivibrio sp. AE3004]